MTTLLGPTADAYEVDDTMLEIEEEARKAEFDERLKEAQRIRTAIKDSLRGMN